MKAVVLHLTYHSRKSYLKKKKQNPKTLGDIHGSPQEGEKDEIPKEIWNMGVMEESKREGREGGEQRKKAQFNKNNYKTKKH